MSTEPWKKPYRIYEVRCPRCGWPHDFRSFSEMLMNDPEGIGGKGALADVECHHVDETGAQRGCGAHMEVVKIEPTTLIWVRPK